MDRTLSLEDSKYFNRESIKYYETHALEYFNYTIPLDMTFAYELLLKYVQPPAKILDVGSGAGRDTRHLRGLGFDVVGMDASLEMSKLSTWYTGQKTHYLNIDQMDFMEPFDCLWCSGVLVHFHEMHLLSVLERLKKSLQSQGVFFMSFKYGDQSPVVGQRYYWNRTEESLTNVLMKSGNLEILEIALQRNSDNQITWLNCIARKIN